MKCDRVTELLADYLDGLLSPGESEMVKDHLARCASCREEARFLKRYRKEAASFPSLKAPDDFLESIHRKIDSHERSGIIRKLFFPPLIKVPLEAAALIALAVTGIIVFRPFPQQVAVHHEAEAPAAIEEKQETSPAERARGERIAMRTAREKAVGAAEPADDTGKKVSDGFAVSEDEAAASVTSPGRTEAPAGSGPVTLYLSRNSVSVNGMPLRESPAAQKLDRSEETAMESARDAAAMRKDRAGSLKSSAAAPTAAGLAGAGDIAALARAMNGSVIQKSCDDRTGTCRQVIVEIPGKNFYNFVEGLKGGWNVRMQSPAAPSPGAERVRIIMHIAD